MADQTIDNATGLPKTVSLGDVLAKIELAPAQIGEFLRSLAFGHLGGANDPMARTLLQHANDVADPATYGNKPDAPDTPDNPQARWGSPGSGPFTGAPAPGSPPPTSPVPAAGAAQAQSALPAFGTTNEPSWMADARAAGWAAPDDTAKQPAASAEPSWMADARAAGWQSDEPSSTTPPQPSAPKQ